MFRCERTYNAKCHASLWRRRTAPAICVGLAIITASLSGCYHFQIQPRHPDPADTLWQKERVYATPFCQPITTAECPSNALDQVRGAPS